MKKGKVVSKKEDFQMLITPEQVDQYFKSESAKLAERVCKQLSSPGQQQGISMTEFCAFRDHLYMIIIFSNGCRSGVPANMTINEFESARKTAQGYVIEVHDHKTDYSFGPYGITLSNDDFSMLNVFVKFARPQIFPKEPLVFLSFRGNPQTGGDISTRLNSLFKKAGVRENEKLPKNWCVNIIRKSVSTLFREEGDNAMMQSVCDTMCHSEQTAKDHYWARAREKAVAEGSAAIRKMFLVSIIFNITKLQLLFLIYNNMETIWKHFYKYANILLL